MFGTSEKLSWVELWGGNGIEGMNLPPVILYATPIMIGLCLLEFLLSQFRQKDNYEGKEFFSSAAIGIGNLISTGLTKIVTFYLIWFFYYYLAPFTIPTTWWSAILCIVCLDFCRYWAHRIAHEQRFWWATHVTHHSSHLYNFAVSFRLSWVQQIKLVFFLPVAIMGFDPILFFICHQIEVLYQFWIHTEHINKLPKPIEFIFTTPSHHRVHHAKNEQYIDKNYGSTFIIWDRIFGTFEPEVEKPIYGIRKAPGTHNPIKLVFQEFIDIYKDVRLATNRKDKLKAIFGRP